MDTIENKAQKMRHKTMGSADFSLSFTGNVSWNDSFPLLSFSFTLFCPISLFLYFNCAQTNTLLDNAPLSHISPPFSASLIYRLIPFNPPRYRYLSIQLPTCVGSITFLCVPFPQTFHGLFSVPKKSTAFKFSLAYDAKHTKMT